MKKTSILLLISGFISICATASETLVALESYPEPGASRPMPTFKVDASWPDLPDTWIIGQVPGLAVALSLRGQWLMHCPICEMRHLTLFYIL